MMLYMVRRGGKHFLRPVNIDDSHKEWPISRDEFFARWRRWGGKKDDIKRVQDSEEDCDVF